MQREIMKNLSMVKLLVVFLLLLPVEAHAYLGPGLCAGTIGAIIGVIVSVFVAIFAVIYYPIKRLFKRKKAGKSNIEQDNESPESAGVFETTGDGG
jgi:uncharacterized membrane protein (DUF485 family)